ncbi:MAG TPA: RNA polymerase factor sigma-54 [Candidatus Paceibacterota bacterium]|nr:RNA polymerase factor sigma-54 [Candidatus Paceibacterota bacterium]HRT57127.1 RNA polymerase factor sigma-54 [Candidatus Paceibacterota bacterium]
MAQGLHLSQRLTQSLILAPQLQQSLALLQAPTLELKALVEQELQQNPVLEEVSVQDLEAQEKETTEGKNRDAADPAEPPADLAFDPAAEKASAEPVDDFQAEFERLVQLDQEWRDYFGQTSLPTRSTPEDEEKRQFMFDSLVAGTSLQEFLLEQVRQSTLPREQWSIAEMLIGNIDDYGYLKATLEELSAATGVPVETIEQVLKVIQTFDPPGVAARDLRECLLLQLERAGQRNTLEYRIVSDFMEALGKRRIPEIARGTGTEVDEVQDAMENIAKLEPRPGRAYLPDNDQYVLPEVFVTKQNGEYVVTTNNDHIPHLRISNTYKDLMAHSENSAEVRNYIREKIRAGKFLIKSLHQRQQTILNIAREIVARQREFLDKGVAYLKPMTMVQVAQAVGVHETTVSRAVSGKYIQTPQGVFEMKYFFTAGIPTASGDGLSNTSVKDMIAEIFRNEDPSKPLSDQEVVAMLKEKGIVIARRTVAKYRTELNILPSNLRKVY